MSDSHISVSNGGTMFAGPDAVNLFRATTVKHAIKMLKLGICPTRGMTMTKALKLATEYSGKKYKRTEADKAIADITTWCDTMSAALPKEYK